MITFEDIMLWGDVNEIAVNPPTIVIEAFDKDIGVSIIYVHNIVVYIVLYCNIYGTVL